jgi:hypothetical protein
MNGGTQVPSVSGAVDVTFASVVCKRKSRFKPLSETSLSDNIINMDTLTAVLAQCKKREEVFGHKFKSERLNALSPLKDLHEENLTQLPSRVELGRTTNNKILQILKTRIAYFLSDIEILDRCQSGSGYPLMWKYGLDHRMNEIYTQLTKWVPVTGEINLPEQKPKQINQNNDNDKLPPFIVPDPAVSDIIPSDLQEGLKILRALVKLKEMMNLLSDKMDALKLDADIYAKQSLDNYSTCKTYFDKIIEQINKFEAKPSEEKTIEGETDWVKAKKDLLEQINVRKKEMEANVEKINQKNENKSENAISYSEEGEEPEVQECLRFLENVVALKEELVWIRNVKLLKNSHVELYQFYCNEFKKLQNVQNAFIAKKDELKVNLTNKIISDTALTILIESEDKRIGVLFSELQLKTTTSVKKSIPQTTETSWTSWLRGNKQQE